MMRFLEADEIPEDFASLVEALLDLVAANRPDVQVKKRYHDMAIWLLIEPERTLTINLVLHAGMRRINWFWRTHEEQD